MHTIPLVSRRFAHFNTSFEGMFCNRWYRRHEHIVRSLSLCEEYDTDKHPAVGSPSGLHFLIAQYQCSLTISARYRMGPQKFPSRIYVGDPSQELDILNDTVSCVISNIVIATSMGWQPNLRW